MVPAQTGGAFSGIWCDGECASSVQGGSAATGVLYVSVALFRPCKPIQLRPVPFCSAQSRIGAAHRYTAARVAGLRTRNSVPG